MSSVQSEEFTREDCISSYPSVWSSMLPSIPVEMCGILYRHHVGTSHHLLYSTLINAATRIYFVGRLIVRYDFRPSIGTDLARLQKYTGEMKTCFKRSSVGVVVMVVQDGGGGAGRWQPSKVSHTVRVASAKRVAYNLHPLSFSSNQRVLVSC